MYKIFFDGGSRGNPGCSGSGYVIYDENKIYKSGYRYLGVNTNNYAEYTALLLALRSIKDHNKELKIYGDNLLVVKQIKGEYKVKALNLQPLHQECIEILKNFKYEISHIPRNQNMLADSLANNAMDTKMSIE